MHRRDLLKLSPAAAAVTAGHVALGQTNPAAVPVNVETEPSAPDPRPAFWLEDVHRADFFAITAPQQQNFTLHNVEDLRIAWSRAAKDTTLATADNHVV